MTKETFILKTKYKSIITKLSDKQAGILFKMLFEYVENGVNAGSNDDIVDMAFKFISLDLDAFSNSYEKKKKERSESGRLGNLKRWNQDLYKDYQKGIISIDEAENIAKNRIMIMKMIMKMIMIMIMMNILTQKLFLNFV